MTIDTTGGAPRVRLGRTELRVSPICFGTWQLSPKFWGDQDADELINAMRHAFEIGVNFYDTADAYGEGYSEEIVGKALKILPRDQIVVATKVFHHFFPDGHRFGDLSYDYIIEECDASLKRMQMDYIDLYQCHSFDPLTHPEDVARAMETLKKQGKIRAYGGSNWNVNQINMYNTFGNFGSMQPYYSLFNPSAEADVLPHCLATDMGTLVYSPLHKGLLSGKYKGNETFDDLRKNAPEFAGQRFKTMCDNLQKVGEIGKKYDLSIVQTIFTVTLMNPSITCAIAGIKKTSHIVEAAGAMGKEISREDWWAVRNLVADKG